MKYFFLISCIVLQSVYPSQDHGIPLEERFKTALFCAIDSDKSMDDLFRLVKENEILRKKALVIAVVKTLDECLYWMGDVVWRQQVERINVKACYLIDFLVQQGVDIDQRDNLGKTALHYAATNIYMAIIINSLCLKKACVNAYDCDKNTPLLEAVKMSALTCKWHNIFVLLEHGADIFAENQKGETPLHFACQLPDIRIFKNMLRYKAHQISDEMGKIDALIGIMNQPNSKGQFPLDFASKNHNPDIKARVVQCINELYDAQDKLFSQRIVQQRTAKKNNSCTML